MADMTHEDAVEALAKVMREASMAHILELESEGTTLLDCIRVGLVAALAPENRETALAALGMEQVGWANVSVDQEYLGIWRDTADVEAEWEPVYVYRGNR